MASSDELPSLGSFVSNRTGAPAHVPLIAREGLSDEELPSLTVAISEVEWQSLSHAYGPAEDIPALLLAVTLGSDEVRREAWWELWGNIHHQGTVYEATVPAVGFVASIASSGSHPDRVNAISFLRQIAIGDGAFAPEVLSQVQEHAEMLLALWERQPDLVQRALVLLASAFPSLAERHPELISRLPGELRVAWDSLASAGGYVSELDVNDDSTMDQQDALERWAPSGWFESV